MKYTQLLGPQLLLARRVDWRILFSCTFMDDSSLRLSSFQLGSLKMWLHVPRLRLAIIYEQRVERIRRDCRLCNRQAECISIYDRKSAFISNEAQSLRERGDIFLERCRQEWLSFHIMGVLLSGYDWPISTPPWD